MVVQSSLFASFLRYLLHHKARILICLISTLVLLHTDHQRIVIGRGVVERPELASGPCVPLHAQASRGTVEIHRDVLLERSEVELQRAQVVLPLAARRRVVLSSIAVIVEVPTLHINEAAAV